MNKMLLVSTVAATLGATSFVHAQPAAPPLAGDAVETLQKVCLPVLRGGDLKASAASAGFVMKDGQWTLTVDRDTSIALNPPDTANPRVCGASITAPFGDALALKRAVAAWARTQTPPLAAVKLAPAIGSGWTSSLWTGAGESVTLGQEHAGAPTASAQSNLQLTLKPT